VLKGTSYTADQMRDAHHTAVRAGHAMIPTGVHSAFRVPADLEAVGFVRSAIACLLEREDWPAEGAGRVLLASSEAVTNAIEHGSPAGGLIEVGLSVTPDRADIRIVDEGVPGVPVPRRPISPPPVTAERGRGLLIISRLADDFDVTPAGDGTEVHVGFWRLSTLADVEPTEALAAA
jgi:anti-sigma regulatory factor (Ser/Thr protein kinase)